MPAPEIIRQLVEKFEENYAAYHSGKYNEAQLRQEFIDKFFEALGWDVYNKNGVAPDYRDVVVEDSLEIEGSSKAPDYAFKIGKERKFYVEAKKPRVDIQYDIHPAYQLKRYAWNAHLPLSILTDFEELAVYNCKNKPSPSDSAATGRDLYFRYTEYVERWDEIAAIFSKDAVWKGSFDRFAESSKGKKGTTGVDDAILDDIENWRKLLALNIALRNPQVADEHQLNYAVQMTIDRILFLRICEDRGIEPEDQLKNISKTAGIYPQLVELFRRADLKYNSGLFHFNKEKGNDGAPDTFTPGLKIDDRVLKEIIGSIYYPCPYIFKEIPVEILGQVYEQFLGKVVRLTAGRQARIEEKPEVRKAGGVYYTPKYIVDYIVQNTVGKLLEGKTPAEAADLKIVDPACGSGSFLLGAFQHLIDWHEQWYNENQPEKWARGKSPAVLPASGGGWKLTTAKKKEILVNNIYGVDIDAQAVEVTKLSLLLKVLEEESGQLSLGLERALPDLGKNIRCGNSLIGPDYYEGRQMPMFGDAELYRVNPFDWKAAFPQVFASETPAKTAVIKPALPPELLNRCRELRKNETDAERLLWALLRDRQLNGLKFRRQHPLGGYILDFYCHEEQLAVELDGSEHLDDAQVRHDEQRTKDLEGLGVRVVRFWNHEVLSNPQGALLAILVAVEEHQEDPHPSPLPKGEGGIQGSGLSSSPSGRGARGEGGFDAVIGNPPYGANFTENEKRYIREKIKSYKYKYESYVYFIEKGYSLIRQNGYLSYITPELWLRLESGSLLRELLSKSGSFVNLRIFGENVFDQAVINTIVFIIIKNNQVKEIIVQDNELSWLLENVNWKKSLNFVVEYKARPEINNLISKINRFDQLSLLGEVIQGITPYDKYRGQSTSVIKNRAYHSKTKEDDTYGKWYSGRDIGRYFDHWSGEWLKYGVWLAAPRDPRFFMGERLVIREIPGPNKRIQATLLIDTGYYGHSVTPFKQYPNDPHNIRYLLGISNSRLISWLGGLILPNFGKNIFPKMNPQDVSAIPIRIIDFNDPAEVKRHDRMVALVESMLALHKQLAAAHTPQETEMLQRQIASTDRQIDTLVYELYGLTEEEIKIVEGND